MHVQNQSSTNQPFMRMCMPRINFVLVLVLNTSSHHLSFYPRTITQWNSFPLSVFDNDDINSSFKHSVSSISHNPVN